MSRRKIIEKKETKDISVDVWHPNDSYKLTLKQIREQLTPAGIYRHKLATTGREERKLRRLEWRWQRRIVKWTKCATIVQAGYRGMVGRRYFKSIRHDLELKKLQREAKIAAIEAFKAGNKQKTLEILSMVEKMTGELYIVQAKVLYTAELFDQCIESAKNALETPNMEPEARYILANCYIRKKEMDKAFDELNLLSLTGDQRLDARKLRAYIATRLEPPNYDESLLILDGLIDDFPEDMNLLLQRASVYCFQQNFAKAIIDYSNILHYQSNLEMVLLLRARAYCCERRWNRAIDDYQTILSFNPNSEPAKIGLEEVRQPILELPMIKEDALDV